MGILNNAEGTVELQKAVQTRARIRQIGLPKKTAPAWITPREQSDSLNTIACGTKAS